MWLHELKPDWPEARQRLTDWWAGKRTDRVVALLTPPRRGAAPLPLIEAVPDKYTDAATVFHNVDAALASTWHGGEAIPSHWVYLGPVLLSGVLGCTMHFRADTVWHSPRFTTWDDAESLAFDPDNQWYRLLCDLTRQSSERANGRYFVSGQCFGCVSDAIANLWGMEETLFAMIERPETIERLVERLTDISIHLFDEIDAITAAQQPGSFDWTSLWAPGRMWTLQSDLCCTISPAMFERFVFPELRREAEHADYSLYHLDGPDAIPHLDKILSISALGGIQWVPGAGHSNDPLDWIPLFRHVQAAGKKLLIYCPAERIRPLLDKIDRQGVCLGVSCADQEGGEAALRTLEEIGT